MTQDEFIDMAKEAGIDIGIWEKLSDNDDVFGYDFCGIHENLEAFAKLVAEAEREACAKLCDLAMLQNQETINELEEDEHIAQCFIQGAMTQLVKTSKAIRERGKE